MKLYDKCPQKYFNRCTHVINVVVAKYFLSIVALWLTLEIINEMGIFASIY